MEKNIVVLSYVDNCVYWYKYESPGKLFVETLGHIFHVNFLGYSHLFMSINISQIKDHSISVDKYRYTTSIVAKYLDTATIKTSTNFNETTFPSDMIFTKADASTSDERVKKLTRKFQYSPQSLYCIIYLFVV